MLVSTYGNMYVTNFSLLFLITIFYWAFLDKEYTYYSIGCHAVLGAVIYLPFIYEWIEVRAKNLI
jgi:multisubunit Na+/H+ antiporter MnhE subunit